MAVGDYPPRLHQPPEGREFYFRIPPNLGGILVTPTLADRFHAQEIEAVSPIPTLLAILRLLADDLGSGLITSS